MVVWPMVGIVPFAARAILPASVLKAFTLSLAATVAGSNQPERKYGEANDGRLMMLKFARCIIKYLSTYAL